MKKWIALFLFFSLVFFLTGPINMSRCNPHDTIAAAVKTKTVKNGTTDAKKIAAEAQMPDILPLGGIILLNTLADSAEGTLPTNCKNTAAMFSIGLHLIILALIAAQLLTFFLGRKIFKWENATTFFSQEYMNLFLRTLGIATGLAVSVWFLTSLLLGVPFLARWAASNTNITSAGQAALPFGFVAFLSPIALAAVRNELFSTLWERVFFFVELMLLVYEIILVTLNIDVVLILLSIPFPSFSQNFNPFFPEEWRWWMKDFGPPRQH